jgi:hypothetical protein
MVYHNFITLPRFLYVNRTRCEYQAIEIIMPGTGIEPVRRGTPEGF